MSDEELDEIELEEESEASQLDRKSREWDERQKGYTADRDSKGYP